MLGAKSEVGAITSGIHFGREVRRVETERRSCNNKHRKDLVQRERSWRPSSKADGGQENAVDVDGNFIKEGERMFLKILVTCGIRSMRRSTIWGIACLH